VQLIAVHGPRRIVLKRRCNPLARGLRWVQSAQPRLYVFLGLIKRYLYRFLVCLADPFIFPDQRCQADRLGSVEGQIPSRPVSDFVRCSRS
jgi:hypothetical protein